MNFLSLNIQDLGIKAKRRWINELCHKHRINFVSLQEIKAETIDYVLSKSVGVIYISITLLVLRWEIQEVLHVYGILICSLRTTSLYVITLLL